MSFQEDLAQDVQKLAVGNIVNLYELYLDDVGGSGTLYFTESIDNDYTPISFNAREYVPIHMQSSGWMATGTESLPRPKIVVSNVLLTFASYINSFDNLVGAKFIRRRTLEKYLDGKPDANPNAEFAPDIFRVRSMPQKTKAVAEFELTPYVDFEKIKIPKRQILRDFCRQTYRRYDSDLAAFVYTKATCPYTGTYCYTRLGAYTSDCSQDSCGKELSDCEMRFQGVKVAREVAQSGRTAFIQDTEPGSAVWRDYWLDTSTTPNVWYKKTLLGTWQQVQPDPLPTWAFPSVARFRI